MSAEEPAPPYPPSVEVVLKQYNILRNIFSHLPAAALANLAEVAEVWSRAAKVTSKDPSRFSCPPSAFGWRGNRLPRRDYWRCPRFETKVHRDLERKLSGFVSELYFEPAFAICLYSGDLENGHDVDMPKGFMVDPKRMDPLLPEKCVSLSMTFNGIVESRFDAESGRFVSSEVENVEGMMHTPVAAMLFFPPFPGVTIVPFAVDERRSVPDPYQSTDNGADVLAESLGGQVEDLSKVKCVVLFTERVDPLPSFHLLRQLGKLRRRQVAVGGCVGLFPRCSKDGLCLRDLSLQRGGQDRDGPLPLTHGVAFAGDGVEAASVLIREEVDTPEKVKAALSELKRAGLDEDKSCALMFACCGRGEEHYGGRDGVESSVFNELFPKTPLVGLFGNGEIGATCIPRREKKVDSADTFSDPGATEREKLRAETPYKLEELFHSYCTVIVLLSFK